MKLLKSLLREFTNAEYREKILKAEKELERVRIASIEYLETLAKAEQAFRERKEQYKHRATEENTTTSTKQCIQSVLLDSRKIVKAKIQKENTKSEKIFKCDQCDYKTKRSDHFITHERTHSGEKPFKCEHCDYACAQSGALNKHKKYTVARNLLNVINVNFLVNILAI